MEAHVEHTQESLSEQRFPEDMDHDDINIGQTLLNAEDEPITLKKKACRPVCHHKNGQIRTLLDRQREQILADCQARFESTNSLLIMTEEVYN